MKRIIRDSVTSSNNKPKNAVWVKDGQDMKWKIFKGTNNDTIDPDFLSLANQRNHANYIDVIVVPNGMHPNEVINSSSQNEYEYRKNIYLKRKHEFETLGEDDNNDVLSREEKMRIAKAEMDKVAPESVDSADKYDIYSSSYTPDMLNELINYYSSQDTMSYEDIWDEVVNQYHNESLADDVLDGLDELEAEDDIYSSDAAVDEDDEVEISADIDEATEDPKWICLDIKHVRDSDGMLTDYALYTTEDEDKYICMFGDVDAYPPDEMYADAEFDSEEEALEWFEDYTGPGDEDEDEDYDTYYDDIDSAEELDEDEDEDDLDHPDQEFDSADTSINSTKLPAIYKMITIPEGSVGIDFGGGKWNNAIEHIRDLGATLCVYDPYNRSKAYNKETLKTLRANGGADWAVTSNVLNVIKEPSARKAVLENISKITKPGAPIYITVYEGRGDGKEGVTKSGYQLNRKTADYLEEIQEVFPDAKRRGKLIVATNKGSANSSTNIKSSSEIIWDDLDWNQQIQLIKKYIRKYKGARIFEDFAEYIDEPVEDIIDAFSDAESRGDIRIPERMQLDSEYRNDDIYSSTTSSSRYWYFTRHGVQPGSVPKYVNILDIVDTPEGSYFLADGVISTDDLRNYEIKERKPKSAVVEASKSPNSAANKYPKYMKVSRGGQNFSVHYNLIDNSPSADAHQMWLEFQASVSAIKPYDDAEYAWAQIENGHINVIKGGKVIQQYYYFDADDMDVENSEWCDIIIDEAIDLIAKINKDIEPRMVYNSTSIASKNKSNITSSADRKIRPIDELDDVTDQLRDDLMQKLVDVMSSPNFGFSRNEAFDYSRVDIRFDDDENGIEVEVGAEVDYDGLMQIAQDLDPIIQSYDIDAYFDAEDAGLLIAFIPYKSLRKRMKVNSASDLPEPSLDPTEYDDTEEVDEDVTVEFDMDRVRIDVDKSGSWEYMDDSFLDAVMTDNDTLYSEEYDVKVRDRNGLLEDLDDILKYDIPVEAGEYRISCHITLVYHITGIEKYDEYSDDNYGDSSEYSTENAEVKFDFHDSYVEDFRIVD